MKLILTVDGLEVSYATVPEEEVVRKVYGTLHSGRYVPYSKENAGALLLLIREGIVDTETGRALVKHMERQATRAKGFAPVLEKLEQLLQTAFGGEINGRVFGQQWKQTLTKLSRRDLATLHQVLLRFKVHAETNGRKRGIQGWDGLLDGELHRLHRTCVAPHKLCPEIVVPRIVRIAAFVAALPIYSPA